MEVINDLTINTVIPLVFQRIGGTLLTGAVVKALYMLGNVSQTEYLTDVELMDRINVSEAELGLAIAEISARHPALIIPWNTDGRNLYRLDMDVFNGIVKGLMTSLCGEVK